MTAVIEAFETGQWVTIGPNITKAPVGKTARITAITPGGSLIVETAPGERYVVPPASCTRHPGPPPGRDLVPLAVSPPPIAPLAPVVAHEPRTPTPQPVVVEAPPAAAPPPRSALPWRVGDRVRLTRDHDGLPAGTEGTIFGRSAVEGYHQVKTSAGVVVVIGEDLEAAVPQGMHRGEREAAERAKHPPPPPTRRR